MKIIPIDMISSYAIKILGGREKIIEDMKNMFKTYDEYKKFIQGK